MKNVVKGGVALLGLSLQGATLYMAAQATKQAMETQAKVELIATKMAELGEGMKVLATSIKQPEVKPSEKDPGPSISEIRLTKLATPEKRLSEIRGETP